MDISLACEWLARADSVAALTGAGISAESGVPTFRGAGGLWNQYRAEDLATPEAFARDPALVWRWYDWRRGLIARARPNAGHAALARLEAEKARFTLVTQNVDGLHDLAGSRKVLKLHGDIWRLRCTACGAEWDDRSTPLDPLPPVCSCGGMARPGVVWFGEMLPEGVMEAAGRAVREAEVVLVVGTSAVVYPAAGLIRLARRVIEVNPGRTPFSEVVECRLEGPAGEILPRLITPATGTQSAE
ncbi:MAG: NAD-dependent deacetylase [Bryobacteraceae bacterium]